MLKKSYHAHVSVMAIAGNRQNQQDPTKQALFRNNVCARICVRAVASGPIRGESRGEIWSHPLPLSDTAAQALKPAVGARITKDHDRDGLFLHGTSTGTKSWVLRYRIHDKERTATLGRYPAASLKKARERALEARAGISDGVDPVQDKRRRWAVAEADDAARFSIVAVDWRNRQVWTPAVRKQYDRMFYGDILPALGRLPLSEVDSAEVQARVDVVAKRGKVVAERVVGPGCVVPRGNEKADPL